MISRPLISLAMLSMLASAVLRAADADGLSAQTGSASDSPSLASTPSLRAGPSVAPAEDALPLTATVNVADAPSGTEQSLASAPLHPDLPPSSDAPSKNDASPSANVTLNLINLMVKRGLLSADDAKSLIQQAQQEAVQAQTAESSAGSAPVPATPVDGDDVNVNYVPDVVKNQIRDDVKADVIKQARDEHWGKDDSIPDWVHRFHVIGDIRVRVEGDYFPDGNDNTGAFTNFNSINTGVPFDVSAISNPRFPPEYDVDQERYRLRMRARIGAGIDLGDGFTAGMRVGTGQDNSPTTENQTLGLANGGQGGDFSKYAVWLDRAFIHYDYGHPEANLAVSVGRFDNPFLSSSMIWAPEIGFDGLAAKGNYQIQQGLTASLTGGFFPVFNTDFNFASNQPSKFSSEDKWLYAGQAGMTWQINKDFSATGAIAMYYFENIEGRLSDPFSPLSTADQGDTDDTRPSFAQNGNTYRELRDIVPVAANDFGTIDQFQYYGLATQFHDLALTGQLDYSRFDPVHLQLLGEFVDNLAFSQNAINAVAVNNRGGGGAGTFAGGDKGFNVRLTVGQPEIQKLWDWNFTLTYRYVESDATIDGFTDSDFGTPLAGTNLQGYILAGYLGITPHISLALRFMSADSIAGPTFHDDLFQFDLNAKF